MFTPKNIQGALEELYDLCDPDYMVDMLVNYSEEFDDISPALLAKSFQKNAEMISEYQLSYVTNSGEGEGLLFYGNVILPFIDRFPTDLELYRIMTTKLNEVAQEKEA